MQGQEVGPHISKFTIWYLVIGINVSKLVKKRHKKFVHIIICINRSHTTTKR